VGWLRQLFPEMQASDRQQRQRAADLIGNAGQRGMDTYPICSLAGSAEDEGVKYSISAV